MRQAVPRLRVVPLTEERWPDLEALFGKRGAYGGCWCMYWRIPRSRFTAQAGEGNRRAFRRVVRSGERPGLLAYRGRDPVGWIAIAPRESYATLNRSRVLKPLDDEPVWSITCFYVAAGHRDQGIAGELVAAAVEHARKQGARVVEAYPTDPRGRRLPPVSSYMGTPGLFRTAGFSEMARPSAARVVMRKTLAKRKPT